MKNLLKFTDRVSKANQKISIDNLLSLPTSQSEIAPNAIEAQRIFPVIESIATGTPDNIISQADAAKFVASLPGLERNRDRIEKIYQNTRINTRHLAYNFLVEPESTYHRPIQDRMQAYKEYGIPLAEKVAKQAIESARLNTPNIEDAIRQIVFVSSTGFIAPGIDTALIEKLGLRRDISRASVNFMGCAAAMNGLHIACDRVRANPTHKSLVICLELSSVNALFEDAMNDVIIHSIFSDGCAAVIVGAGEADRAIGTGKVIIKDRLSYLVEATQNGIILGVKDTGITCQLSRHLPEYIEAGVEPIINRFLASNKLTKEDINWWAVHPGGTRIIESVQRSLGLSDDRVADSWHILSKYGNMLSVSLLFVIERMLFSTDNRSEHNTRSTNNSTGIAFSFSPGVGIEGILFEKI